MVARGFLCSMFVALRVTYGLTIIRGVELELNVKVFVKKLKGFGIGLVMNILYIK